MSAKRKSYTSTFKLMVCERAEAIGNRGAARENDIDERCVRRWRKEKDVLEKMPRQKRARRGGKVSWPVLEANLEKWIKDQREKNLPVSTVRIRMQAKMIAEQMGITNFKGGPHWCYRFMRRKKLSVRVRTTVGQALPADWQEKKQSFLQYVHKIIVEEKFSKESIINMDEVPLTFDCPPNRTVSLKGEKTVSLVTTGNEKTSFTCVLACAANGDKLKPLLIFKRKTLPKGNFPTDVVIRANEKGWMSQEIFLDWLDEVWRKRKGAFFKPRGLLIFDSMRAHLTDPVKHACKKASANIAVIPGGLTKILQPLDITINCAFKCEMRKCWEEWMRNGTHSFTKSGHMRKATYEEVAEWVSNSWKKVKSTIIVSGFTEANIVTSDSEVFPESQPLDSDDEDSDVDDPIISDDEILKLFNSESELSDFDGFN